MTHEPSITVLVGPTASGKSALALRIAQARPTVIINADAMQMVADLRVLSARPTPEEEALEKHALYGVLDAAEPTSVARWLALVGPVIREAWAAGMQPLLVGGTGMYLKALMDGLAAIPPIPESVRARVRAMATEEIRAVLETRDASMAAKLKPGDTQRNARALEVVEATGKSLEHWQGQKHAPLFPGAAFTTHAVMLPRAELYRRIDGRFEGMMQAGALEEVRRLRARHLSSDTPILRAHGVPELMAHLDGTMPLAEAIEKAQQNTRNYAKRQMTWIRRQMGDASAVQGTALPESFF